MKARISSAAAAIAWVAIGSSAWANHPVLVEGNCDSPVPGTTIVDKGFCGDFDGDGRIGTAEDTDGADRIFGTINAALGPGTGAAAGTGANQNGTIIIVTSGRFAERVEITARNGHVILKAAPGVEATIDAVLQGDPAGGNTTRQNSGGIVISTDGARTVQLQNLTVRNYTVGILVGGPSQVAIINCRIENNLNYGILVLQNAEVRIDQSFVISTGYRVGAGVTTSANPGVGISFQDNSRGAVFRTLVSNTLGAGLVDQSTGSVISEDNYFFNN